MIPGEVVDIDLFQVRIALRIGTAEHRFIAQLLVLEQRGDSIEAEARYAAVEPEANPRKLREAAAAARLGKCGRAGS